MPASNNKDPYVSTAIAILSALTILYSLIIAKRPLLGMTTVLLFVILYLFWRFVRAIESIADALE